MPAAGLGQRLLAIYTLSYPLLQAALLLLWPLILPVALWLDLPLPVTIVAFLPLYVLGLQLVATAVGARLFTREYGFRLPVLWMLGLSALRAVYRELRRDQSWEKTDHAGAHRQAGPAPEADPGRPWMELVDSSYALLDQLHADPRFGGPRGLLPTWVGVDPASGELVPAEGVEGADEFGYDGLRAPWRLAAGRARVDRALRRARPRPALQRRRRDRLPGLRPEDPRESRGRRARDLLGRPRQLLRPELGMVHHRPARRRDGQPLGGRRAPGLEPGGGRAGPGWRS